jgi:DNA-binding NarL/FixJ family response regulator
MIATAVLAADPALRGELAALLRSQPGLTLVGTAGDTLELARLLDEASIAVVLVDAPGMDAGLDAWPPVRHDIAWVLLIEEAGEDAVIEALAAGARAVLPRAADAGDIALAIAAAARGLSLLSSEQVERLVAPDAPGDALPRAAGDLVGGPTLAGLLTPREIEVLTAMADGAPNKVIARRLGISFHTVKFHVASILAKLDADSRTEAVAVAARQGLVML